MKKWMLYFLVIGMVLSISGCADKENIIFQGELGYANEITAKKCIEKIENGDTFIVILGQENCPNCELYQEYLQEYMNEHPLYIDWIVSNRKKNKELLLKHFEGLEYTPTSLYIKDGQIVDSVVGALTGEQIQIWLNRNDIVLE